MKKRGLESICQSVGPAERVVISTARAVQMIDDLLKAQKSMIALLRRSSAF
jgi:hypothetical protein